MGKWSCQCPAEFLEFSIHNESCILSRQRFLDGYSKSGTRCRWLQTAQLVWCAKLCSGRSQPCTRCCCLLLWWARLIESNLMVFLRTIKYIFCNIHVLYIGRLDLWTYRNSNTILHRSSRVLRMISGSLQRIHSVISFRWSMLRCWEMLAGMLASSHFSKLRLLREVYY